MKVARKTVRKILSKVLHGITGLSVIFWSLGPALLPQVTHAALTISTATTMIAPQGQTTQGATTTPVLKLTMRQDAGETFTRLRFGLNRATSSDFLNLANNGTSGIRMFKDTGGAGAGVFDGSDMYVTSTFSFAESLQFSMITATSTVNVDPGTIPLDKGDIVFANTTANPNHVLLRFPYEWHIVTATSTTGATSTNLRLDDATAIPTFAAGSYVAKIAHAGTATGNANVAGGSSTVVVGDLVFTKATGTAAYTWHMVTAGAALSDDAGENDAALNNNAADPAVAAGATFSRVTPTTTVLDNGVTDGGTLAVLAGDIIFYNDGSGYNFSQITGDGNVSSDATECTAKMHGLAVCSPAAAGTQMSKISTGGGTLSFAKAATTDANLVIPAGNIVYAQTTKNPLGTTFGFHQVTLGTMGVNHSALRLDNSIAPPVYGIQVWYTLNPAIAVAGGGATDTYYLTVTTKAAPTNGNAYSFTMMPGDVSFSANSPTATPVAFVTADLTIDTTAPTFDTSMSGPPNNATGVPISSLVRARFSEDLDMTSVTPQNVTFISGGQPVTAVYSPRPMGFDVVPSVATTYLTASRYTRFATGAIGDCSIQNGQPFVCQGSYVQPAAGDIVLLQRDAFPPEFGVVTDATQTGGTFKVNDFALFGPQTLVKVSGASPVTGLVSGTTNLTAGDIIIANTGTRYAWHIVTTGAAVNSTDLRLDGAGAAPTFVAGSRFTQHAANGTQLDDGAAAGNVLAVALGDIVFVSMGGTYGWHIVTTAGNLSSLSGERTAVLDTLANAAAVNIDANSQMTKVNQSAFGAVAADAATWSRGDVLFAHVTTNASMLGAYNFHIVTGPGTGIANARLDNFIPSLNPNSTYILTVGNTVTDRARNPLAATSTITFTTSGTTATNTTPPFVLFNESIPNPGMQNFPPNVAAAVKFSVPMSVTGGATGADSVTNPTNVGIFAMVNGQPSGTTPLAATNAYNSTTNILTITPTTALTVNADYGIKVATTAKSSTGIPFGQPTFIPFRTAAATDITPPTVIGAFPGTAATGVTRNLSGIGISFSEAMNATTITTATITINPAVAGSVKYDPAIKTAFYIPNTTLAQNTEYTVTAVSGGAGVKDLAGVALAANYTTTFTTANTVTNTTPATIVSASADTFNIVITFDKPMKTGGGPDAVDSLANYAIESPVGSQVALDPTRNTISYDGQTMTARIQGLQNSESFKVTVGSAQPVKDTSDTALSTAGGNNVRQGPVAAASQTGGQLGPGAGATLTSGMQMFTKKIFVAPFKLTAGATSNYGVRFDPTSSIPSGGKVVLTFPLGTELTSAVTSTPTESANNSDLNGPGTGAVTIASFAVNALARTATLTTGGAATGTSTPVSFDLKNIVNTTLPCSTGCTIDIKTYNASNVILESLTSNPFFLGTAGTRSVTVNVFNDNGAGGGGVANNNTKDGTEPGIQNAKVFLNGEQKSTDVNGQAVFTGIPDGSQMIFLEPGSVAAGGFIVESIPTPLQIAANTTRNFGLRTGQTISGTVTGPVGTRVDVFAQPQNGIGFMKTTLTLTGGADAYTLGAKANTIYNVGVGPAIADTYFIPGSVPPPPPIFTFQPPPNQQVQVAGANVANINFAPTATTKTITGRVVDSGGVGLSGVHVSAKSSQATSLSTSAKPFDGVTNANGDFSLSVVPGLYQVFVFKPGAPMVKEQQINVPIDGTNSPTTLTFTLSFSTVNSLTISGSVKDSSGLPIKYAGVSAEKVTTAGGIIGGGSDNFTGAPTDSNGNYTLVVTTGRWVLKAFAPGGPGQLGSKTLDVTTASLTGQDFSAQSLSLGTVTGRVRQNNVEVNGAEVFAFGPAGANRTWTSVDSAGTAGQYSLSLPVGTYDIRVRLPGGAEVAGPTGVAVTVGATTANTNVDVGAGIVITVNVTDGVNPVSNVYVDVRDANGRGYGTGLSTISGANAVYVVTVPPGTYTVRAGSQRYGPLGTTTGVNTTQAITYTVANAATFNITGTVLNGSTAVSSAWVRVFGIPTGRTEPVELGAQTDVNGAFTVAAPAGTYRLGVSKDGVRALNSDEFTVTANTNRGNVAVTTMSRTITGTVKLDNVAVSGAWVNAEDGRGGFALAQSQPDGSYTLNVSDGTWNITARSVGYEGDTATPVSVGGNSPTGKDIALSAMTGYTIKATKQENFTPANGALITNTDIGARFKVDIGANIMGSETNPATLSTQPNPQVPDSPTARVLTKSAVTIDATDSGGAPIKTLEGSITITVPYDPTELPAGTDENKLVIGTFNTATKVYDYLPTTVDATNNTLTTVVDHLSDFAPLLPTSGAPNVPTNLAATASNTTTVALSWTAQTNAATYNVYRSTDGGSTFPLLASTAAVTYTDSTLTANTTYAYKVSSVNSGGNESAASNSVTVATPTVAAAAAVVNNNNNAGSGTVSVIIPASSSTQQTTTTTEVKKAEEPAKKVEDAAKSTTTEVKKTEDSVKKAEGAAKTSESAKAPAEEKSVQTEVAPEVAKTLVKVTARLPLGATGKQVKTVKEILKAEGVYDGPTTGKLDSMTRKAVGELQEKYGVAKPGQLGYGNIGPKTQALLNRLIQTAKDGGAETAAAPSTVETQKAYIPSLGEVRRLIKEEGVKPSQIQRDSETGRMYLVAPNAAALLHSVAPKQLETTETFTLPTDAKYISSLDELHKVARLGTMKIIKDPETGRLYQVKK